MFLDDMNIKDIDVNFDCTSDTKDFWDGFWDRGYGLGVGKTDPDKRSQTLRDYHRLLWSKKLPNGEFMQLEDGKSKYYLKWKNFYFGSDSIIVSFRNHRNKLFLEKFKETYPNYKLFFENYTRTSYSIAGSILFPSSNRSINQLRGLSSRICDRWDLTMECIRRYYQEEESPLSEVLEQNKDFFDLFVDFKGFVDFFFLQDCVSEDCNQVVLWYNSKLFKTNPIPNTMNSYLNYINLELQFLEKRKKRIAVFCQNTLVDTTHS